MSSAVKHKARSKRSSNAQKGYYAMDNKNYLKRMLKHKMSGKGENNNG